MIQRLPFHIVSQKINIFINHDLIVQWLRANRVSLNTSKKEIILFRSKNREITKHLNFRISGPNENTIKGTKYFEIYLDETLHENFKLNRLKVN